MPITILAIDDSPTLRKFISKHLGAVPESFEVLTAANGEEGVQTALEKQPQLILLDFILPDFNGDKVCEKLAESELTRSIPIVLMSSSAPDIEKTEKAFASITHSIVKPFSPQLLLSTVQEALEKKEKNVSPEKEGKGESPAVQPEATPQAPATAASTLASTPAPFTRASADEPAPVSSPPVILPQQAREKDPAPAASPALPPEAPTLLGNLAYFPLLYVIRAASADASTGRLEIDLGPEPMTLYLRQGLPCLVTSRDADAYLSGGEFEIDEDSRDYFETLKQEQHQTGRPLFLRMADENIISPEQAHEFLKQYGEYYFALAWTASEGAFRFFPMTDLPDFCPAEPLDENLENWCLQTLRCLPAQMEPIERTVQAGDSPQLDARGYHLVQHLPLIEVEINFIRQLAVTPGTVETLASQIGETVENLKPVIFRLQELEIVSLWAATE